MRYKSEIYFFPLDSRGEYATTAKDGTELSWLIGESMARIICANTDPFQGLQLVRIRVGNDYIIAHKRINDIKVTVSEHIPNV